MKYQEIGELASRRAEYESFYFKLFVIGSVKKQKVFDSLGIRTEVSILEQSKDVLKISACIRKENWCSPSQFETLRSANIFGHLIAKPYKDILAKMILSKNFLKAN